MSTDYYSAHSSPNKLFATDENYYRAPLLVKMQRISDCRFQNPIYTSVTQLLHHKCERLQKRGWKYWNYKGFETPNVGAEN